MSNPECRFLTTQQLDEFCRLQRLDRSSVEPRSNGAHRDVLMAPDRVYLFPRKPKYVTSMLRELQFLKTAAGMVAAPLPRYLDLLHYPDVFASDIGVISRMDGDNWEDIQEQFSGEFIAAALDELVDLMLTWHSLSISSLPFVAEEGERLPFSEIPRMQAWLTDSLNPSSAGPTVEALHADLVRAARELDVDPHRIISDNVVAKWIQTVKSLAAMPRALLHGDMHEGQILLHPEARRRICGLLDWEAVQFGNPMMDFSFHKWGWGRIWVFRDRFPAWRRDLWGRYLNGRGIGGLSPESLHLYCCLTEALRTLIERDAKSRPAATATRKPFDASLAEQFAALHAVTERI